MRVTEAKDKEEFKASIGKMVESQVRSVCEEVLGRKIGEGERPLAATTAEIRRRTYVEAQMNHEGEDLRKKEDEIVRLKQTMAEMQKQACRPHQSEQELTSLRMDNQYLIQNVIRSKEQVNELIKTTRATVGVATTSSPLPASAREKEKTTNEPTPGDIKLIDAYKKLRDDKDMAEREVQALKERINRIGFATATPTSMKRKRILRKSVSPPSNLRIRLSKAASPVKSGETSGSGQLNVKFVKLKNEWRDKFKKRVCIELSKLKKKEIEQLCGGEGLEYVTIQASAAAIADIYTDRAFGKRNVPPSVGNTETPEDSEESKDLVGGSEQEDDDDDGVPIGC
ncbi:hypothetical protein CBR_g19068 [Chara braunii]|uniref:Uncharacterized protein n=1 Tax=Chara braunii TaxID=69332 RepID=A0A388KX54_CHABU|nr:hypothetical protein CBR_g19068 [Chara braunii]|eukprot:GBG74660.1 hypothetical protein CBR_g19068 [Chara braunii]